MIEGTFNSFGRHGCIVENPDWAIRYQGEAYGGSGSITGDMLDWTVMAVDGIPLGDLPTYLASAHPVVIVEFWGGTRVWQYQDDEWEWLGSRT